MAEKTIKQKRADSTLSIKLSEEEITRLKNDALRGGFDDNWQDFARKRFREEVTGGLIGSPTVGHFKKVTAPTNRYGR